MIKRTDLLNNRIKDKYKVILLIFLVCFHFICNLGVKIISFSSDEFIPLSIAANCAGLDWSHARAYDYYYGYVTLIFCIPIFKIPFIYKNPFLLTQCLLAINSLFHIIMSIILYKSIILFNKDLRRKNVFLITIISTSILQVFVIGMGIQIESLFCLSHMVVFYILLKILNGNYRNYEIVLMSFFSCVAYMNNSRGIVLIISSAITIFIFGFTDKKRKKVVLIYFSTLIVLLIMHKYIIKPSYMTFFAEKASNTDPSSLIKKMKTVISEFEYLLAYFKTIIGWFWALNVSTYGVILVSLIIILLKWIKAFKKRWQKDFFVYSFILLNFWGTFVVSSMSVIETSKNLLNMVDGGNRADFLIYVRYMTATLTFTFAIGLIDYFQSSFFENNVSKACFLVFVDILGKIFYINVACPINGIRYGVNNSVFLALIQQNFEDTYRYGNIISKRFWIAQIIMMIFVILILELKNKKQLLLSILTAVAVLTCIIYVIKIPVNRSNYYCNLIDKKIIDYCKSIDNENIYISGNKACVGQYLMPDKVVYHDDINTQDVLIVSPKKEKDVDKNLYHLVMSSENWCLYEKKVF